MAEGRSAEDEDGKRFQRNLQKKQLQAWLDQTWAEDRSCPICHAVSWELGDMFTQAPEYDPANFGEVSFSEIFPLGAVFCSNCGYSFFINLVIAGFITEGGDKAEEDQTS